MAFETVFDKDEKTKTGCFQQLKLRRCQIAPEIVGFRLFVDNSDMNETLARWHEFIENRSPEILNEILAEEVRFHSPFVWKPKDGKVVTTAVLLAATEVFRNFRYVREISGENQFCLEFAATVGEFDLRGVDLIELDADGRIVDFEVMIRPANALQQLGAEMSEKLKVLNAER